MTDEEKARWIRLVADFEASDLTQREFATERGISYTNLRNWIYRVRGKPRPLGDDEAKDDDQGPGRDASQEGSRVVPVRVVRDQLRGHPTAFQSTPRRGEKRTSELGQKRTFLRCYTRESDNMPYVN